MIGPHVALMVMVLYLLLLFGIAHYADSRKRLGRSIVANPYVYALSLCVYVSAWTFYGSIGRAASTGLEFLPIYLGPVLAMTPGLDRHSQDDQGLQRVPPHLCERLHQLPLREKLCHWCCGRNLKPGDGHALCGPAAHSHLNLPGDPERLAHFLGDSRREQAGGGPAHGGICRNLRCQASGSHGAP